jgi:hypothetical protein
MHWYGWLTLYIIGIPVSDVLVLIIDESWLTERKYYWGYLFVWPLLMPVLFAMGLFDVYTKYIYEPIRARVCRYRNAKALEKPSCLK